MVTKSGEKGSSGEATPAASGDKPAAPAFKWDEASIACVATYKVLELPAGMDEFEDLDWPITNAGTFPMSELRSWPGVDIPAGDLQKLGRLLARKFLPLVQHMFHGKKPKDAPSSAEVINEFQAIFANATATFTDLAAQVDKRFVFPK